MSQSKLESFIETCINTAIGFVVAVLTQIAIFPMFDIHIPISDNLNIACWFTLISVVRGYVVRRYFNSRIQNISRRFR